MEHCYDSPLLGEVPSFLREPSLSAMSIALFKDAESMPRDMSQRHGENVLVRTVKSVHRHAMDCIRTYAEP